MYEENRNPKDFITVIQSSLNQSSIGDYGSLQTVLMDPRREATVNIFMLIYDSADISGVKSWDQLCCVENGEDGEVHRIAPITLTYGQHIDLPVRIKPESQSSTRLLPLLPGRSDSADEQALRFMQLDDLNKLLKYRRRQADFADRHSDFAKLHDYRGAMDGILTSMWRSLEGDVSAQQRLVILAGARYVQANGGMPLRAGPGQNILAELARAITLCMDLWQPEQTLTALKDALACGKALDCTEDELNAFQAAICSIAARWERQPNAEPFEHHHRVVILDTWATIYDIVAQIDMKQGERLLMILGRWPAVKTDLTLILGDERIFMRLLKFQLFKIQDEQAKKLEEIAQLLASAHSEDERSSLPVGWSIHQFSRPSAGTTMGALKDVRIVHFVFNTTANDKRTTQPDYTMIFGVDSRTSFGMKATDWHEAGNYGTARANVTHSSGSQAVHGFIAPMIMWDHRQVAYAADLANPDYKRGRYRRPAFKKLMPSFMRVRFAHGKVSLGYPDSRKFIKHQTARAILEFKPVLLDHFMASFVTEEFGVMPYDDEAQSHWLTVTVNTAMLNACDGQPVVLDKLLVGLEDLCSCADDDEEILTSVARVLGNIDDLMSVYAGNVQSRCFGSPAFTLAQANFEPVACLCFCISYLRLFDWTQDAAFERLLDLMRSLSHRLGMIRLASSSDTRKKLQMRINHVKIIRLAIISSILNYEPESDGAGLVELLHLRQVISSHIFEERKGGLFREGLFSGRDHDASALEAALQRCHEDIGEEECQATRASENQFGNCPTTNSVSGTASRRARMKLMAQKKGPRSPFRL